MLVTAAWWCSCYYSNFDWWLHPEGECVSYPLKQVNHWLTGFKHNTHLKSVSDTWCCVCVFNPDILLHSPSGSPLVQETGSRSFNNTFLKHSHSKDFKQSFYNWNLFGRSSVQTQQTSVWTFPQILTKDTKHWSAKTDSNLLDNSTDK